MKLGTLYGIGIGPGDPDLVTVKGARLLGQCRHVFAPKARIKAESLAHGIAGKHINPAATIHELVFPMSRDKDELRRRWDEAAQRIAEVLKSGDDACFVTLGDPFLYSTYIYMLRALRRVLPSATVETVPGVNAFSAAAAAAEFPVGEAKEPVTIVPAAEDLGDVRRALASGGTVVLMKIGKRLKELLVVLDQHSVLDRSVLVARVGLSGQKVETNLRRLLQSGADTEYLAVILVHASDPSASEEEG
jgi:precorrin-2/cobalt-factor-2 C20-methyltransferase